MEGDDSNSLQADDADDDVLCWSLAVPVFDEEGSMTDPRREDGLELIKELNVDFAEDLNASIIEFRLEAKDSVELDADPFVVEA